MSFRSPWNRSSSPCVINTTSYTRALKRTVFNIVHAHSTTRCSASSTRATPRWAQQHSCVQHHTLIDIVHARKSTTGWAQHRSCAQHHRLGSTSFMRTAPQAGFNIVHARNTTRRSRSFARFTPHPCHMSQCAAVHTCCITSSQQHTCAPSCGALTGGRRRGRRAICLVLPTTEARLYVIPPGCLGTPCGRTPAGPRVVSNDVRLVNCDMGHVACGV